MNPFLTVEAFEKHIVSEFSRVAGEQVTAEVIRDEYYVFCSELAMYRIADKYKYNSKGFSKNLNTWYVSISHTLFQDDPEAKVD